MEGMGMRVVGMEMVGMMGMGMEMMAMMGMMEMIGMGIMGTG